MGATDRGEMMQYDTAGNPILFYDMCAFCTLDTGGNHQAGCPCYQPRDESVLASRMKVNAHFHYLVEQGYRDLEQGKYKEVK